MESMTMKSMTGEIAGTTVDRAFAAPVPAARPVTFLGSGVSVAGTRASSWATGLTIAPRGAVHARERVVPVTVVATDAPKYLTVPSFADGVVRSCSWSDPV